MCGLVERNLLQCNKLRVIQLICCVITPQLVTVYTIISIQLISCINKEKAVSPDPTDTTDTMKQVNLLLYKYLHTVNIVSV